MRVEIGVSLPETIPATRGLKESAYDITTRWVEINPHQVSGLLTHFSQEHPWLDSDDSTNLSGCASELGSLPNQIYRIRTGGYNPLAGILDLERTKIDSLSSNHIVDRCEKVLRKTLQGATVSVIDGELLEKRNWAEMPKEFQYVLGRDALLGSRSKRLMQRVKTAVDEGAKFAFVRVNDLPPRTHNALRTAIGYTGGVVEQITRGIDLNGNVDKLHSVKPEYQDKVTEAANILNQDLRRLLHVEVLSPDPKKDSQMQQLEDDIDEILDAELDSKYAVWRYTNDVFRDDIAFAGSALGLAAAVGLILSQGELTPPKDVIDFVQKAALFALPLVTADLATNIAAASPLVEIDERKVLSVTAVLEKRFHLTKEMAGTLASYICKLQSTVSTIYRDKDYLHAIGKGLITTAGLIFGSEILQGIHQDAAAGFLLGLASPIPTRWTLQATRSHIAQTTGSNDVADQTMESHPVEKSIEIGSYVAGAGTFLLGLFGGLKDSDLYVVTTILLEPFTNAALSLKRLKSIEHRYNDRLDEYVRFFQKTYPKLEVTSIPAI